MTENDLIKKIEAFAKARGIAPATVTSRAVGNSRLYKNLKTGQSCTFRIAAKLSEYIDSETAALAKKEAQK